MKKCSKCNLEKDMTMFYKNGPHLRSECVECFKIKNRNYYISNADKCRDRVAKYRKENPEKEKESHKRYMKNIKDKNIVQYKKQKVRNKLVAAVRSGNVKKENLCSTCSHTETVCHHEDYTKPYDFIELCKNCHYILHDLYKSAGVILNH